MPARSKIAFAAKALMIGMLLIPCAMRAQQSSDLKGETLVIGLLIEDSLLVEGRFAAEYAIQEINNQGGLHGRTLALSVRSMEGPWGAGSKQAVSLVFDEKVWALVGLLNGRNSHLVEQVAAKTDVPFISAWAADPTLSKAYVPHFFNCVPNSEQQGKAVLEELSEKQMSDEWILVSDDDYDSRIAVKSLEKIGDFKSDRGPLHIKCDSDQDFEALTNTISEKNPKALVVYCEPERALKLIRFLRSRGIQISIYSNTGLLHERTYPHLLSGRYENLYFSGSGGWINDRDSDFAQEFHSTFDRYPGAMAAYAYDAIQLLAQAMERSGLDPKKLKQSLSKTSFEGKTGSIQFDSLGNRKSTPKSVEAQSGILSLPNP